MHMSEGCVVSLTNCSIHGASVNGTHGSTAPTPAPWLRLYASHGAGIYVIDSYLYLRLCTIVNNSGPLGAPHDGEAVYNLAAAGATMELPTPAGRFASPTFLCLLVTTPRCGGECPQICARRRKL